MNTYNEIIYIEINTLMVLFKENDLSIIPRIGETVYLKGNNEHYHTVTAVQYQRHNKSIVIRCASRYEEYGG